MSATATMIASVRRMTAEPTATTYTDTILSAYIEAYPLHDADGLAFDDTNWTATYDLNAAAAGIWLEKAASVANESYDIQERVEDSVGSGDYNTLWRGKSELGRHALQMYSHYWAKRSASSVSAVIVDGTYAN